VRRVLVAPLLVLLLAAACSSSSAGPSRHRPIPAENATHARLLPTDALALPDFTPEEFQALLRQLRGTPVVVNIWGSWCAPCLVEGPHLAAVSRTFGRRVQFLGLDVKDEKGPARSFVREMGWRYPSVFDPSPNAQIETALGYLDQPVTIFLDRRGKTVDVASFGATTVADLRAGVEKALR
jgi:thiol-disulfide isomerase/thioredoxin